MPTRFLPDGALFFEDATGRAHLFKSGVDSLIALPTAPAGAFPLGGLRVTWFQDARHYGGYATGGAGQLQGGWAVLDDTLRECEGTACAPIYQLADGTFVGMNEFTRYWQKWKPGQNPSPKYPALDDLDIHDASFDVGSQCYGVRQIGGSSVLLGKQTNGLLECFNSLSSLPDLVLLKDLQRIDISIAQFDRGLAVDFTDCCFIQGINEKGQILGVRGGIPAIKTGEAYELVDTAKGTPLAFNDVGDVIFTRQEETEPLFRWQGRTRPLSSCSIVSQAGATDGAQLLKQVVDLANDGSLAFWLVPPSTTQAQLFVATPRTDLYESSVVGNLDFTPGSATAPAHFRAANVSGNFGANSFSIAMSTLGTDGCSVRSFTAFGSRPLGTWAEGDLLPVTTTTGPGGVQIANVSFAESGAAWVATGGGLRVTQVKASGFSFALENVTMKNAKTGELLTVTGAGVVPEL